MGDGDAGQLKGSRGAARPHNLAHPQIMNKKVVYRFD
jgi:hypothetical protein